MKTQTLQPMFSSPVLIQWLSAALLAAALSVPSSLQAQRIPNPGVLPASSTPYGQSYGNWGAAWWTWAGGINKAQNPVVDPTGEFCDVGQEGPVWFLAGTFGGNFTRSCSVPRGKALLVPMVNQMLNAPEDVAYSQFIAGHLGVDSSTMSVEEVMRLAVNFNMDHATALAVTVDGVAVTDPAQYRNDSDVFSMELSDIFEPDYPAGFREVNVADGYYVLLRPLSPGVHTVVFQGGLKFSVAGGDPFDFEFSSGATYHLTIE